MDLQASPKEVEVFRPELQAFGTKAIIDEAVEQLGRDVVVEVLGRYRVTTPDLNDSSAWVSLAFVEALLQDFIERSGDEAFLDRAALRGMTPKYLGALYPLLFALGTPGFTYRQLARVAHRVNKTGTWEHATVGEGQVRVAWVPNRSASQEARPFLCRFRVLQLTRIPVLFDLPPAEVRHVECVHHGSPSCVYEVRFEERGRSAGALLGLALGGLLGATLGVAEGLPLALLSVLAAGSGLAVWGVIRTYSLRQDLRRRIQDIAEHNNALERVTRANEQRFEEVVRAKAEVEQRVEQRTLELREASQRLSETLEEVQALDRAKTDFFNNVSHELRSPLTLILAPLEELVAGRTPPGGERTAFEGMHRNAVRLLRLINQLLDLAKIDAGRMKIAPSPADLIGLVRGTLAGFEAAAAKKGVALQIEAPPSMPPVVIDASWIESAVTNLVANALRLTPRGGGVRVTIEDHGSEASMAVSDDGPGIAAEDQQKVFERFAQGDSTKRVVGGTGIGLALVREAARLHGGDVKLVSELGQGATFTLTLPRRPDQPATIRPAEAKGPSWRPPASIVDEFSEETETGDRPGPAANAALALVVEDNAELREFIANVLGARYRVKTASNGKLGVALALELKPDVVISDVAMPEMDGYQLCRALRAEPGTRATPILLVTARTEVASVLEGFEAGASDYVLKPFHGRELLARVDVHVRLRRIMQEMAVQERHATLGVLAASVAHQVRNPLTTLVSGLPAMRTKIGGTVPESTRKLMDVMVDCAQRIERMTIDLMDLSRVDREAGGDYTPSDGLRSAIRLVSARLSPSVTLSERIEDAPEVHGRPGDMNHVFLNLLDNAARAVGDTGAIRVEASIVDGMYVVGVDDSGPGIDQETAEHIFEPFFTTRPAGEGTGLGLAVAHQVLMQCGGDISVSRSDLGGARFTVRIPVGRRTSLVAPAHPTIQ